LSDEALKLATKSYNDEMLKRINEVKAIFEHEAQIPAGTFQMGSLTDKNSRPVHSVTISKPFLMAKAPVTVGQFRAFVQGTGYKTEAEWDGGAYVWANGLWDKRIEVTWRNPGFAQQDDCPVVCVSWTDTQAYIKWLNNKNKDLNYRLPTEAEWEYACRAGTTDERYGDLNDIAWYHGNSGNRTNPVGGKKPNGFGLYDMQGNVWQWCQDGYADNYDEGGSFPKPQNGVIRGGGWGNGGQHVRSAYRAPASRSDRRNDLGFRVVAVPQNQ
jgi:formylglycine-generating enzyme required for sulfatase activity